MPSAKYNLQRAIKYFYRVTTSIAAAKQTAAQVQQICVYFTAVTGAPGIAYFYFGMQLPECIHFAVYAVLHHATALCDT